MKNNKIFCAIVLLAISPLSQADYKMRIPIGVNLFPNETFSYSEWENVGDHYDCNSWSPLVSDIDFGEDFVQSKTCSQLKARTVTTSYSNNRGEVLKSTDSTEEKSFKEELFQNAVGRNANLNISLSNNNVEYHNGGAIKATAKNYDNSNIEWESSGNLTLSGKTGESIDIVANSVMDGWVKYRVVNGDIVSGWSKEKPIGVVNQYVDTNYLVGTQYSGNQRGLASSKVSSNFTIETWVKPQKEIKTSSSQENTSTNGTSGENYALWPAYSGNDGSHHGMGVSIGTNGIKVFAHSAGYMPSLFVSYRSFPSSAWTHVTVSVKNNVPYVYINDVFIGAGLAPTKGVLDSPTTMGSENAYGPFYGRLGLTRVRNVALTASEVANNWNRYSNSGKIIGRVK